MAHVLNVGAVHAFLDGGCQGRRGRLIAADRRLRTRNRNTAADLTSTAISLITALDVLRRVLFFGFVLDLLGFLVRLASSILLLLLLLRVGILFFLLLLFLVFFFLFFFVVFVFRDESHLAHPINILLVRHGGPLCHLL